MNSELFVGNLPYSATEQGLTEYFGSVGKVESVKIITDMHTGRSRGYGFIKMESKEVAAKAIEDLNGKQYGEGDTVKNPPRPLKVNEAGAERRTNSGPRPGGSGQGGGYRSRDGNGGQGGGYRPREDRPREGGAGDRRPRSW